MAFSSSNAERFIHEYNSLVFYTSVESKQLKDLSQYEPIRQNIIRLAKSAFGLPVEVNFFGSRIIGVATEESDLDINVCIDKKVYKMYSKSSEQQVRLQKLKRALQSSRSWKIQGEALNTAVPTLFTVYSPMNLDCDININNGVGTRNSRLIAHLFTIQQQAVLLVNFIRMWFKKQGFNHLKGYTITLLVLFYLQSKNLMPPVVVVQQDLRKEIIDGWEVQFDQYKSLCDYNTNKMTSYKYNVKDFFKFYKDFDYSNVMSTYGGRAVPYWEYKERFPTFCLKGIHIAGPVNRAMNCGIVDDYYKYDFIRLCKSSHAFLKHYKL